jgi:hypothetical protein
MATAPAAPRKGLMSRPARRWSVAITLSIVSQACRVA